MTQGAVTTDSASSFPPANLPPSAQAWARAVMQRVAQLEDQGTQQGVKSLETNKTLIQTLRRSAAPSVDSRIYQPYKITPRLDLYPGDVFGNPSFAIETAMNPADYSAGFSEIQSIVDEKIFGSQSFVVRLNRPSGKFSSIQMNDVGGVGANTERTTEFYYQPDQGNSSLFYCSTYQDPNGEQRSEFQVNADRSSDMKGIRSSQEFDQYHLSQYIGSSLKSRLFYASWDNRDRLRLDIGRSTSDASPLGKTFNGVIHIEWDSSDMPHLYLLGQEYIPGGGTGGSTGSTTGSDLPASAATGQVLTWNGTAWDAENLPAASGGPGLPTTATAGQFLQWNGSAWAAANPPASSGPSGAALPASATTGQVLTWDGTAWDAEAPAKQLPTTATTGQLLTWNGNAWVAQAPATQHDTLDGLTDVSTAGATSGQLLGYNGSNWAPMTPGKELPASAALGQVLEWNGTAWTAANLPAATGGWTRQTVTYTTASLAAATSEVGLVQLAPGYRIYRVQISAPGRVRLYDTTAHRDNDRTRDTATSIDRTTDTGLMLDMALTNGLAMTCTPLVDGVNFETGSGVPITVDNLGSSPAAVTVTLTFVRTE